MAKANPIKRLLPSVSIIGSGRLGTALAIALTSAGYSVEALVAQTQASARKAAGLLGKPPIVLAEDQLPELPPSRLILITTPDDAISQTARNLASISGKSLRRTVLHTSGALSSDVLLPLSKRGANVGSLHPLVSVSQPRTGAKALLGAFWCLEGDKAALSVARSVVRSLKGSSFSVPAERKALYHAAAVMAAGHSIALFDICIEMLVACGMRRNRARQVLLPLVESTVANLRHYDSSRALTGTFARGDLATVERHLRALAAGSFVEATAVYKLLGRRSLELSEQRGLDQKRLRLIREMLQDPGEDQV